MDKKVLLAGLVCGIVMFFWGILSHAVLGLGETGIRSIPSEGTVIPALQNSIKEAGFYFFPPKEDETSAKTKEAREAAFTEKYKTGPSGIIVYNMPTGTEPISPKRLVTQAVIDVVVGIFAAFLLSRAATGIPGFGGRVGFVALIGLVSGAAVLLPYWNWYGFPTDFTIASMADQVIGFGLGGIVLAAMIKPTTV